MPYDKFLIPGLYTEDVHKLISDWDIYCTSMMELLSQRKMYTLALEYDELSEDWFDFFAVSLANAYFKKMGLGKLGSVGVFVDEAPDGLVRLHEKVKKEIKVDEEKTLRYIFRSALYWIHKCEDKKTYKKYLKCLKRWYKVDGVNYGSWLKD